MTDIDQARLDRVAALLPPAEAERHGVKLTYVNTRELARPEEALLALTGGKGFDDVFVFAPVRAVAEIGDRIMGKDGCLNFFAGPTNPAFTAEINLYNVHYSSTHLLGTSGGNTEDMVEALKLMSEGRINPAGMITHVGGLTAVIDTTLSLPKIPGGKKLMYTHLDFPLTAIADFADKGKTDPLFRELAAITARHQGLWSVEAERYLLEHAPKLTASES